MTDYIEVDKYTAVQLEDGGQYGWKIVEGNVDNAGKFWPAFCRREFKRGSGEKKAPVSIKLGDKAKAIAVLETMIKQLKSDVPF